MIKRLLVILLLNRVAHSMGIRDEAKSSDVDSYSLYDSIKVSNSEASLINERKRRKVRSPQNSAALGNEVSLEELPSVGVNGGRKYINRLLKTLAPTQAADNINSDIQEKTTDESLADFLLESVVNIGLVQAKVNTALKNYRADIQKNMLKELKKIATEVYKELDSSSSSDSSDSDDEDSDDEDVIQWDEIVQATRSPLFKQDGEDEESSRFSRFKQDDDSDDSDDDSDDSDDEEEDEDEEDEDEEEEEDDRSGVTERRGKFFYTDYYDEQI
jgi:hypothetical protein